DALGSAIRIDSRGNEVLRILPRTHDAINEEWISDKTRHAVDGLRTRRLDRPLLRVDNRLEPIEWSQAFALLGGKIKAAKPEHIAALTGPLCDAEAIFALKQMMTKLGVVNTDCRPAGSILGTAANNGKVNLGATRFNSSIAGIDSADLILIIGSNPRWEAAVLNARIRKRYLTGKVKIALVGAAVDLTYPYLHLGDDASVLKDLTNGKTKGEVETFRSQLLAAESPMVIVGDGVFAREDAAALTVALDQFIDHFGIVRDGWNGYNCLQRSTGIATGLEVGFIPGLGGKSTAEIFKAANGGEMELLYLLGVDEFDLAADCKTFIVYQGHHGDAGAHRADLILPAAAYSEKSATYFNLEGRPQLAALATFPPGEAREDWKIIRALAEPCGVMLDYIDLGQLRAVMAREIPSLKNIGQITKVSWTGLGGAAGTAGTAGSALSKTPLGLAISDFYLTDPISRASKTMQNCSKLLVHGEGQPDPLEAEAVYG
ncbi:MAG: molybdopterin-dependent oxidoreductase, partial [Candidatus Pacebacteria bacterium]|nr:molybdopterin-dependent oxidoreductase [Candidatus Paceibacterota bacterium]